MWRFVVAKMIIGIHRLSNKSCHRARVFLSSSLGLLMNYGSCFGRTALGLVLCVAAGCASVPQTREFPPEARVEVDVRTVKVHGPYILDRTAILALPGVSPDAAGGTDEEQVLDPASACGPRECLADTLEDGASGQTVCTPSFCPNPRPDQSPLILDWDVVRTRGQDTTGVTGIDPQIAVSSTHVVVTATGGIGFFERNGKLLQSTGVGAFFHVLTTLLNQSTKHLTDWNDIIRYPFTLYSYYDPRVLFDPFRKRFFIAALARNTKLTKCPTDPDEEEPCSEDKNRARRGWVVFAVSLTEDPRDGFAYYFTPSVPDQGACNDITVCLCAGTHYAPGYASDYPRIGISKFDFLITNTIINVTYVNTPSCPSIENYDSNKRRKFSQITAISLDDLVSGSAAPRTWMMAPIPDPEFPNDRTKDLSVAPTPVRVNKDVSANPGFSWLVSHWYSPGFADDRLIVWGFLSNYSVFPLLFHTRVSLDPPTTWESDTNPAYQRAAFLLPPDVTMHLQLRIIPKAVIRDDRLYTVFGNCRKWGGGSWCAPSLRHMSVDLSEWPSTIPTPPSASWYRDRTFGGLNVFDDPPGAVNAYGWPAVDVNVDGHVVISYQRSGAALFPEARFSAWYAGQADIHSSFLLKEGEYSLGTESQIGPVGKLDITGSAVDPFYEQSVWIVQAYAYQSGFPPDPKGSYRLRVGKVFGSLHPDLIITGFKFGNLDINSSGAVTSPFQPGDLVNLSVTIRNQGDGATSFPQVAQVVVVLSEDKEFSSSDTPVAQFTLGGIPAGKEVVGVVQKVPLPAIPPSSYYVLAVVDPVGLINEYSETNNSAGLFIEAPLYAP